MGLDMYLEKRHYVRNWEHMKAEERHSVTVTKGGLATSIKPERVSGVTELLVYWRKANAIHAWFVKHVQDGKDECQDSYCDPDKLQELHDTIVKVLANKKLAPELLPTQGGFFFGGTEYNEWYWEDIEETRDKLAAILAETKDNADYYYHSSW